MRSRVSTTIVVFSVALMIGGCVEARYRYNSQNVYITPWTHLSPADREEVLQVFSRASRQPIIAITAYIPKSTFPRLNVISGFDEASEVNPWREYTFERRPDGWHNLGSGPIGQFITGLILSTPPPDSRHKRPNQTTHRTPAQRSSQISDD
jgi:hypothetical protein